MMPKDYYIDVGFQMHVREWQPAKPAENKPPFLLVHGLASNAHTWNQVAKQLAAAGHARTI